MNLVQFAGLSQVLTGYGKETILPDLDTQHMAQEYLDVLNRPGLIPSTLLQQLTTTWTAILASPSTIDQEQQVQDKIVNNQEIGPLAKNIINLWYLGIWYDIFKTSATQDFVVSAKAYKNSLVWTTIGAHPMGYSEGNFGYWNTPPIIPAIS